MKIRAYLVGVPILAVLAAGLASAQLRKGADAPDFKLTTLDGKEFRLQPLISEGKERKAVVVLAFWATWCPPCRAEAPHLQRIHKDYADKGVAVIGVSLDDRGAERVKRYVEQCGLKYTILLDPNGSKAAEKYRVRSIPSLFVLDGKGTIRAAHVGYSPGSEKELEKEIKQILDGK